MEHPEWTVAKGRLAPRVHKVRRGYSDQLDQLDRRDLKGKFPTP